MTVEDYIKSKHPTTYQYLLLRYEDIWHKDMYNLDAAERDDILSISSLTPRKGEKDEKLG